RAAPPHPLTASGSRRSRSGVACGLPRRAASGRSSQRLPRAGRLRAARSADGADRDVPSLRPDRWPEQRALLNSKHDGCGVTPIVRRVDVDPLVRAHHRARDAVDREDVAIDAAPASNFEEPAGRQLRQATRIGNEGQGAEPGAGERTGVAAAATLPHQVAEQREDAPARTAAGAFRPAEQALRQRLDDHLLHRDPRQVRDDRTRHVGEHG
ncbi:hypothetical protein LS48_14790, partial [Aequorivita aquimaris]